MLSGKTWEVAEFAELLAFRVGEGERYLVALEELETRRWEDLYHDYVKGSLSLPQKLALIHPRYYREREEACGFSVRGDSLFARNDDHYRMSCDAVRVWGVPCQLSRYESVQADHFFPHSLGGPTIPENRLSLCPLHNQLKTNDVHFFAWESGEPEWLARLLERIRRLLKT